MFTNPYSIKTPSVSSIGASETNAAGTAIERALDGTNGSGAGGTPYTLLYPLILDGENLEVRGGLNCTAASTNNISGTTTIAAPTVTGTASFVSATVSATLSCGVGSTAALSGTNNISGTTTIVAPTLTGSTAANDIVVGGQFTVAPTLVALSPAVSAASRSCKGPMVITTGVIGASQGLSSVQSLTVASGEVASQFIDCPHRSTLTGVRVYLDPQDGSPLPGTRASARVWSRVKSTGVATALSAAQIDTNVTVGSYQPYHSFTVTLTSPETVDHSTKFYWIEFYGELPADDGDVLWHGSDYIINNAVGDFT